MRKSFEGLGLEVSGLHLFSGFSLEAMSLAFRGKRADLEDLGHAHVYIYIYRYKVYSGMTYIINIYI